MTSHSKTVDILILGGGWTSNFLIPLCEEQRISYAVTSRSGRPGTIPFVFEPDSDDTTPFAALPSTKSILISFPIKEKGASERLVRLYQKTHEGANPGFIQLGSTGIWDKGLTLASNGSAGLDIIWQDRHSPYNQSNERAKAEEELLALSPATPTTVLNLSGLWGGSRLVQRFVGKVAQSKEILKTKGSVHLIHGQDVALAIIAVHNHFDRAVGQRWIITDTRVYDWWDLASAAWPGPSTHADITPDSELAVERKRWVLELMNENGVRALPRNPESLGRTMDSREFWSVFGLVPTMGRTRYSVILRWLVVRRIFGINPIRLLSSCTIRSRADSSPQERLNG